MPESRKRNWRTLDEAAPVANEIILLKGYEGTYYLKSSVIPPRNHRDRTVMVEDTEGGGVCLLPNVQWCYADERGYAPQQHEHDTQTKV